LLVFTLVKYVIVYWRSRVDLIFGLN